MIATGCGRAKAGTAEHLRIADGIATIASKLANIKIVCPITAGHHRSSSPILANLNTPLCSICGPGPLSL